MHLLKIVKQRKESGLPHWNRAGALEKASELYLNALRWAKQWKGRGRDEDMEAAFFQIRRALNYVTYLYLAHLYRKLPTPKNLMGWQDRLFNAFSTLSMTEFNRKSPLNKEMKSPGRRLTI